MAYPQDTVTSRAAARSGERKAKPVQLEIEGRPVRVGPVRVDSIDVDHQRMRDILNDDALTELAADIAAHGLMQPIGVHEVGGGRFQLIWGLRRYTAHRQLQREFILARVYDLADTPVKALALCENLHRAQMTLKEECDAVGHLHFERKLSPDQISALVSKGRTWVLSRLSIPGMSGTVRDALLDASISLGAAEAISLLEDESTRALVLQQAIGGRLTVTQVRELVSACRASPQMGEAIEAGVCVAQSQVGPAQIMMACVRCERPRNLEDLQLVRICVDGCITVEAVE